MKSLAVIASGGTTNAFIQILTLLMASVHSDLRVRVLFRDAAVLRLRRGCVNAPEWSEEFRRMADQLPERLKKLDLLDLEKLCNDIKASGDVKYYACSSSLALCGLKREDLIGAIDEVRGLPAFLLEDVAAADCVLTF